MPRYTSGILLSKILDTRVDLPEATIKAPVSNGDVLDIFVFAWDW